MKGFMRTSLIQIMVAIKIVEQKFFTLVCKSIWGRVAMGSSWKVSLVVWLGWEWDPI